MDRFTLEIFDDEGKQCTFYTVKWEDAELSETDKFFSKYKDKENFKDSIQQLSKFIQIVIGEEYGALEDFFRFENSAQALPPTGNYKVQDININYNNFPFRLYCLRISDSLVVLFNGGEKTAKNAQGGNTSMAFHEANGFAKRITEALKEKEIYITQNKKEFRYYNDSKEIII